LSVCSLKTRSRAQTLPTFQRKDKKGVKRTCTDTGFVFLNHQYCFCNVFFYSNFILGGLFLFASFFQQFEHPDHRRDTRHVLLNVKLDYPDLAFIRTVFMGAKGSFISSFYCSVKVPAAVIRGGLCAGRRSCVPSARVLAFAVCILLPSIIVWSGECAIVRQ
jgi:hypothetical protein